MVNHPNRHGKGVVVTTSHRGVFFGYLADYNPGDSVIYLKHARCCVYWTAENQGFIGLTTTGPKRGDKIGPQCPSAEIRDITGVWDCSDDAIKAWESATWR